MIGGGPDRTTPSKSVSLNSGARFSAGRNLESRILMRDPKKSSARVGLLLVVIVLVVAVGKRLHLGIILPTASL